MTTLIALVGKIRSDLDRDTTVVSDARIKQAIVEGIEYYKSTRLGFNQKRATSTLPFATQFYALPDDWLEVDHLRSMDGANNFPMREVTFDELEDLERGTTDTGHPVYYAIQNRQLRLWPATDSRTYSLHMSYLCELPSVSYSASDDAENPWTTEAERLIKAFATREILENHIRGDEHASWIERLRNAELETLKMLKKRANREQSSALIRPTL